MQKYPRDHWWRKKYEIPFGSPAHREMDPLMIIAEYVEDKMYEKAIADYKLSEEKKAENQALLDKGIWLKDQKTEKDIVDDIFDEYDMKDFKAELEGF